MKKITQLLIILSTFYGFSQCPAGSAGQWPTSTISAVSDNAVIGISTCNYTGEYSVISNIVPGNEYEVLISLNSDGSSVYATVENAADNSVIAHGTSPVSFTAPAGVTDIFINWTNDASCGETDECHTTSIQCTSCDPLPAPDCASEPISPEDGATDVAVGTPITVSWTAPSSGPTPTGYEFLIGLESDGSDLEPIGTINATSADITFNFYNTTYYWSIRPLNGQSGPSDCPIWSFTTEAFTGSTPTPLDTITIDECGVMQTSSNAYDASVDGVQWIQLDYAGGCGSVVIDTDDTTGVTDTELGLYTSDGSAIAIDDDGGEDFLSLIDFSDLEAGTYYIATGNWNMTFAPGFDVTTTNTTATGTIVVSFMATEALSLEAQERTAFKFYPNPTKDLLYLESLNVIDQVTAYNLLGQKVLDRKPDDLTYELDLSDLENGAYFIKVSQNGITETIRVLKE